MKLKLSFFVLFAVSSAVSAQAATDPALPRALQRQQDQIIQQQQERLRLQEEELRRQRSAPPELEAPEKFEHVPSEAGDPCLEVQKIRMEGVTALSPDDIAKLLLPYEQRCLTLADINNLLRDVTNAYIDKGFVTSRAFVAPEQEANDELRVLVIEGRVEKIIINDGEKRAYYQGVTAFPGLEGELLNLRDIEQGLDQLNRLQSGNASMELEPGDTLGGTIIRVSNPPARNWRLGLGLDNLGQESTGQTQYSLSLTKDNFIGLGDQVAVYWMQDVPIGEHDLYKGERKFGHNNSFSAYFSIPYGYWTFSANLSRSAYDTQIFGINAAYNTSGNTSQQSLQLDRVIHRDADSKTSIGLSLNLRNIDSYIEGFKLDASSYNLTTLQASFSHSRRMLGGFATLDFTYARGLPWFGTVTNSDLPSSPRTEFDKYSTSLNWYRPFELLSHNFYWSASAYWQLSPQTLYGSERVQVGGKSSVRGFHADSIIGDQGGYLRNEIGWNLPWLESLQQSSVLYGGQLYAAYDCGFIHKDRRDSFERGEMQGVAIGFRTLGDLSLDVSISKALDAPDFVNKMDTEFYASINYTF